MSDRPALYVLACGAKPAGELDELVGLAMKAGWNVHVGATPSGLDFLDVDLLADMTGNPVRHTWSGRTSSWTPADGIIVAPATINTVNKIAAGITDTWAVNVVVECMGLDVPIVIAPNVNPALGRHPRYRTNIEDLRNWGICVLWDPDPEPPAWMAPWQQMLDEMERRTERD